jgi:hypothetical protein
MREKLAAVEADAEAVPNTVETKALTIRMNLKPPTKFSP